MKQKIEKGEKLYTCDDKGEISCDITLVLKRINWCNRLKGIKTDFFLINF